MGGPGVTHGARPRLADAGDLADAGRVAVEDLQRLDPEAVDDARGQLGADPLDEPRPEVAAQPLQRRRRDLGVVLDLELRAVANGGLVAANHAQRRARRNADQAADDRDHLAVALELQPGDRERPVAARIDHPLDRAEQGFVLSGAGSSAARGRATSVEQIHGLMGPHGSHASHANFTGDGVAAAPAARRPTATAATLFCAATAAGAAHTSARAAAARSTAGGAQGALHRGRQPLRRRLLLLVAAVLRLRPLLRAGARPSRGHRRLLPLRRLAAADPEPRHLPRGRRHHDGDARLGRHPPGRAGERAARDPPVRQISPPARPCVSRRRGPPVLRAPGARLPRDRPRARRQPARRRGRAGGLDHHAAGGQVVPVVRADDPAEDPRGDPGPPPRAPVLEARDPDALPQPGLPRPRRLRRGGGGAHLLRQADRGSRSRGDGAPGGPRPRAVALLAAHQPRRRPHAPRSGAGHDGRLRLSHRRRGQPLARAAR